MRSIKVTPLLKVVVQYLFWGFSNISLFGHSLIGNFIVRSQWDFPIDDSSSHEFYPHLLVILSNVALACHQLSRLAPPSTRDFVPQEADIPLKRFSLQAVCPLWRHPPESDGHCGFNYLCKLSCIWTRFLPLSTERLVINFCDRVTIHNRVCPVWSLGRRSELEVPLRHFLRCTNRYATTCQFYLCMICDMWQINFPWYLFERFTLRPDPLKCCHADSDFKAQIRSAWRWNREYVQGDTSRYPKPSVDFKTKVPFWTGPFLSACA